MTGYFDEPERRPGDRRGQFVLTSSRDLVPEDFERREGAGWVLGTCDLPVVDVRDRQGTWLGWCLGHPVLNGALAPSEITLDTEQGARLGPRVADALYERLAGRFALALLAGDEPVVLLDAYGSLAAVYSAERRVVASTPTLVGAEWDTELVDVTGFPERGTWLPFGLTLRRGVRRVLANHALDLRTWQLARHWSPAPPEGSGTDVAAVVHRGLRDTIEAVAATHPLTLSLTAGRDSRILLACARGVLERASTFTLVPEGVPSVDAHLAGRLAARFGLDHGFLPVDPTPPESLAGWLAVTGHAVGGELWRAHDALRRLDPARVLLPGTAGEVGRGHTHRAGDPEDAPVPPERLLARLRLPAHPLYFERAEAWLASLPDLPHETTLELGYIEQRLSCWAGPGHYGNQRSRFELAPFASRPLFRAMLAAPLAYRHGERLADDICAMAWPELLDLPFNRFTGLRGTARRAASGVKRLAARARPVAAPAGGAGVRAAAGPQRRD